MANLLIEIGTEELPLGALDVLYGELVRKAEKVFREKRLGAGKITMEATPRRVALFVESLAFKQTAKTVPITGPSHEKAYDAEGNPTKALQGFLKSKGAKPGDVKVVETPKGRYVVIEYQESCRPAVKILPEVLSEIFTGLSFPKWMRWESTGFRFPRPIRWVVALMDKRSLSFTLGDVKAGCMSYGHRFLSPKPFKIKEADWKIYAKALRHAHVVLELAERKAMIRRELEHRFHQKGFDEDLVAATAQLVEEPFLMEGSFSKTFLELPAEVLASCMKKNQKIFACYGPKSRLTSHFVAVLNGKRPGLGRIRADYENVLESRLRDARYFYDADTKTPLEMKAPLLEQIIYLGKLGNMRDKARRLEQLAGGFSALLGRHDLKEDLKRVAALSKADLMTQLVYEFPDLQGVVGGEYAREAGEKAEVARAIATQYLPKNLAEDYRDLQKVITPLGAIFAMMDRLDLLVGAFGTGLEPTGSQDPFALRRAGGSLVKLIRSFRFHFSLREAIQAAFSFYGGILDAPASEIQEKLIRFLEERTIFEIQVKAGSRSYEILSAVFSTSFDDIADVYDRYEILNRLWERESESFLKAVKVVERTSNILKGVEGEVGAVNPELFQESLEMDLYELLKKKSGEITVSLEKRDYEKTTDVYGRTFAGPIHDFFDKVMVNVEDPALRANRQALMKQINGLYTAKLADLSVLSRID